MSPNMGTAVLGMARSAALFPRKLKEEKQKMQTGIIEKTIH